MELDKHQFHLSLARQYYELCEAYDQAICKGRTPDGTAMPTTDKEFSLINRNALRVLRELSQYTDDYAGFREAMKELVMTGTV